MQNKTKSIATFGLICALCVTAYPVYGMMIDATNGTERSTRTLEITEAVRKTGWLDQCKRELNLITKDNAQDTSPDILSEKYLNILSNGDIQLQEYNQCIQAIADKYSQYGIDFNKELYLHKGSYHQYIAELESGKYNKLLEVLAQEKGLSVPKDEMLTSSQALVLEMARHTGVRWATGQGVANGLNLRYSQECYIGYTSDITNSTFTVRTDCSGFIYTILRELGCDVVANKSASNGFNTQELVRMCSSGEMAVDPRLKVLPFNIDDLRPGDIMVCSVDERLTRWGTQDPYVNSEGNPIRKGHTEVFINWAEGQEQAKDSMYVYSWGSTGQVNAQFVNATEYKPLLKNGSYNYTYIIRFTGGYDLWQ